MKFKIVSLFILTLLLGVSCKKELIKLPTNAVPVDEAFKSLDDFNTATLGMYFQMVHADNYLAGEDDAIAWASTLDLLADNLIGNPTGRGSQKQTGNWQYSSAEASLMFKQAYVIIRSANAIIENINNLPSSSDKDNYTGEAIAVRAMVHFDLLRVYSKPVSGPEADLNALGVSYVTSTNLDLEPDRGTVKNTYDNIVKDLNAAVLLIGDNNGTGRLNKAAVYGLLSRVYLYGGEWQKCVDASKACLALNDNPGTIQSFPLIWKDQSDAGVLFKIKVTAQDKNNQGNSGQPVKIGVGYGQGSINEWVCSYSLFQMFDSTDVRTRSYIGQNSKGGINYNAIIKYLARGNGDPQGMLDIKYLRVAEVLLNEAEAYSILGHDADALSTLDMLRKNRYTKFTVGTEAGQALKDVIAKERRLELAFEGDRWFDLKRKGLPVARDQYGERADGTGVPYAFRNLPASDIHWQYPLPIDVVQANPNLAQNPGF